MRGADHAIDPGLERLLARARLACNEPSFKRVVLGCCDGVDDNAGASRLVTDIHPNDQMFTHSLREHRDVGAALSQYFNIGLQQYAAVRQLLGALFAQDAASVDVLDFACGYGRLLRFLTLAMPARRITAAELQFDALDFVARNFGVATLRSTPRAAMFETAARFDFIWVASLFSHLPDVLFRSWLDKLYTLLTPRGVLYFSVRDEALLPPGEVMPTSGFLFFAESENADLGADIYGTAYASETFVRTVADVVSRDAPCLRLPRALANEQDLYLLSADMQRDFSGLAEFDTGTWGWLDRRELSAGGELHLEGWAGSRGGAADHVAIVANGERYEVTTDIARLDVAAAFANDALARSGWRWRHQFGDDVAAVDLEVTARSTRSRALLYAGRIERET